jgi:hypothetical protein
LKRFRAKSRCQVLAATLNNFNSNVSELFTITYIFFTTAERVVLCMVVGERNERRLSLVSTDRSITSLEGNAKSDEFLWTNVFQLSKVDVAYISALRLQY